MAFLTIIIKPKVNHRKILIEMDADKFERLAASLGFFRSQFLKSLDQAEKDHQANRIRKIKSLRELRK